MKVGESSLRDFNAATLSLLLMMTLPSSSSSDALCVHNSQLAKPLPSPTALPSAKPAGDRKSTRLNSSHQIISYAVFCLKKKKKKHIETSETYATTNVYSS